MGDAARKILSQALELSPEERAEMAAELLRSLDLVESGEHDLDRAWDDEIARRIAEIEAGAVTPLSWEEAQRVIDADDPGR